MGSIRMICVDLDGTLLDDDHASIPPQNIAAIRRAAACGVQVVPATGRILARLPAAVRAVPQLRYAILINGAEVLDLAAGQRLYTAYLPAATALDIYGWAKQRRMMPEVYQDDHMLIEPDDLALLAATGIERAHLDHLLQNETPVADLRAHLRAHPDRITKLNLPFFADDGARQAARQALLDRGEGLMISTSMEHNVEVNAPGATKGKAAQALCRALGFEIGAVMAIGDGDNDRELLAAVGHPVAMGNAEPGVLALAEFVTDTNTNAGVAAAIDRALRGEIGHD